MIGFLGTRGRRIRGSGSGGRGGWRRRRRRWRVGSARAPMSAMTAGSGVSVGSANSSAPRRPDTHRRRRADRSRGQREGGGREGGRRLGRCPRAIACRGRPQRGGRGAARVDGWLAVWGSRPCAPGAPEPCRAARRRARRRRSRSRAVARNADRPASRGSPRAPRAARSSARCGVVSGSISEAQPERVRIAHRSYAFRRRRAGMMRRPSWDGQAHFLAPRRTVARWPRGASSRAGACAPVATLKRSVSVTRRDQHDARDD